MPTAQSVPTAITVTEVRWTDEGKEKISLEVPCADYDALVMLSTVLSYNGLLYGRTGWNSDRCVAYYQSGVTIAHVVKG